MSRRDFNFDYTYNQPPPSSVGFNFDLPSPIPQENNRNQQESTGYNFLNNNRLPTGFAQFTQPANNQNRSNVSSVFSLPQDQLYTNQRPSQGSSFSLPIFSAPTVTNTNVAPPVSNSFTFLDQNRRDVAPPVSNSFTFLDQNVAPEPAPVARTPVQVPLSRAQSQVPLNRVQVPLSRVQVPINRAPAASISSQSNNAERLRENYLAESMFEILDEDKNDLIDIDELCEIFRICPIHPTRGEIINDPSTVRNNPRFINLFQHYDRDHNANIDRNEFKSMFNEFHPNFKNSIERFLYDEQDRKNELIATAMSLGLTPEEAVTSVNLQLKSDRSLRRQVRPEVRSREFQEMFNNYYGPQSEERQRAEESSSSSSSSSYVPPAEYTTPVQAMPPVAESLEELSPTSTMLVTETTIIANGVTFKSLYDNLKIFSKSAAIQTLGLSQQQANEIYSEIDRNRCVEIHKTVRKMILLEAALNDLMKIAGINYSTTLPNNVVDVFKVNLINGVRFFLHYDTDAPKYSEQGYKLLINHLCDGPGEGLREYLNSYILPNQVDNGDNPKFVIKRFIYCINKYLEILQNAGRAGHILYYSYVMNYLNMAVSGYGHSIETFINSNGTALPGNGNFVTGCGPGNSDRVVISLKDGISAGLRRIWKDPIINPDHYKELPYNTTWHIETNLQTVSNLSFPEYNPSTNPIQVTDQIKGELFNRIKMFNLSVPRKNRNLEAFKQSLVDYVNRATEETEGLGTEKDREKYLKTMSSALYAKEGNDDNFVKEYELDNPRADIWDQISTGGRKRKKIIKKRHTIKKIKLKKRHTIKKIKLKKSKKRR